MDKKYELSDVTITLNDGRKLYRIKALKDFSDVKVGDLGGFIESEHNLSHDGDCWLYNNTSVIGDAQLYDNAKIYNQVVVNGKARVYGNAILHDRCFVSGNAQVYENAILRGDVSVSDDAKVHGVVNIVSAQVFTGNADIENNMHYLCLYPMTISMKDEHENGDVKLIVMNFFRSSDGKILITNTLNDDENVTCTPIDDVINKLNNEYVEDMDDGVSKTIRCLCEIAQSYIKI